MRKATFLPILTAAALLMGCGTTKANDSGSASEATSENPKEYTPTYDLDALKALGDFSIVDESGNAPSYDESTNTYTIAVNTTKVTYTLSGFFDGNIVIDDINNLGDSTGYKGVQLELDGAALVSTSDQPIISYEAKKKNVEVRAKKETTNYVLNYGAGDAIGSENNIELDGKGSLLLYTANNGENGGHTVHADGDISIYDSITLNLVSGHDALHAENIYAYQDDDGTITPYSGTTTVEYAYSQAFEGSTSTLDGTIDIKGGNFLVNYAESVFKSDVAIDIAGSVVGTDIWSDPVAKQDNSTTLVLTIAEGGSFTVNGSSISSGNY